MKTLIQTASVVVCLLAVGVPTTDFAQAAGLTSGARTLWQGLQASGFAKKAPAAIVELQAMANSRGIKNVETLLTKMTGAELLDFTARHLPPEGVAGADLKSHLGQDLTSDLPGPHRDALVQAAEEVLPDTMNFSGVGAAERLISELHRAWPDTKLHPDRGVVTLTLLVDGEPEKVEIPVLWYILGATVGSIALGGGGDR